MLLTSNISLPLSLKMRSYFCTDPHVISSLHLIHLPENDHVQKIKKMSLSGDLTYYHLSLYIPQLTSCSLGCWSGLCVGGSVWGIMSRAALWMCAGFRGDHWRFKLPQFRIFILLMVLSFEIGTCHLCWNENRIETPCSTVTFCYEDRCKHQVHFPFKSQIMEQRKDIY